MLRKENIQGKVDKTIDDPDENDKIATEKKQDTTELVECEKKN